MPRASLIFITSMHCLVSPMTFSTVYIKHCDKFHYYQVGDCLISNDYFSDISVNIVLAATD